MNKNKFPFTKFLLIFFALAFVGCSTISKKDCQKDMYEFGLSHGRTGQAKILTDEIIEVCMPINQKINPENYVKGFKVGWAEFCTLQNAFNLGKKSEHYVSHCPAEKENSFYERFSLGKRYSELKSNEEDLIEDLDNFKTPISSEDIDEYRDLEKQLSEIKIKLHEIEMQSKENNFKVY